MKHSYFVYVSEDDFADAFEVGIRPLSKGRAEAEEGVGEVVRWQRRYSMSQARAIYRRATTTLGPWERTDPPADRQVAHYKLPIGVIIRHLMNAIKQVRAIRRP